MSNIQKINSCVNDIPNMSLNEIKNKSEIDIKALAEQLNQLNEKQKEELFKILSNNTKKQTETNKRPEFDMKINDDKYAEIMQEQKEIEKPKNKSQNNYEFNIIRQNKRKIFKN